LRKPHFLARRFFAVTFTETSWKPIASRRNAIFPCLHILIYCYKIMSKLVNLGANGCDPFPAFASLWSIYSKKGMKTIFVSLGASKSCLADLEIAESLSCPLHIVPLNANAKAGWEETINILVAREANPSQSEFSKGAHDKWVISKNIRLYDTIPWWTSGNIELDNSLYSTQSFLDWVKVACLNTKLENDVRIDILKLDLPGGLECSVLGAMLNAGIRPGCILVNWEHMPDEHTPTTLAAGHLQSCGYQLVSKLGKKFFYYFVDQDMYMTCSWEDTVIPNPMVKEILLAYTKSKAVTTGLNATNKSFAKEENSIVSEEKKEISEEEVKELSLR